MKICWDNLEKLRYNKSRWYSKNNVFIYMNECKNCKEPYLTRKANIGNYCDLKCSNSKSNHPSWKGGVKNNNIPLYDTYAQQIEWCEKVKRCIEDQNILEVKCTYCGKWYIPKIHEVYNRIQALNGKENYGEARLYCSSLCKNECPIYYKKKFSAEETNTKQYSREVQPELRQMVFERDNYTCQKCGNTKSLHCHHITGVELNPIESADIDNCLTYCKKCHKEVHEQDGCKRSDFKRKKC